eukprot:gb/GECH01013800.1/.p1 GENE.gb/GECH01013800.1/~~gb/GECH01013800.1/.p1  ORF type:complete len:847 (+),score=165.24 gb/GECH01013800.1/:1-2541(+)
MAKKRSKTQKPRSAQHSGTSGHERDTSFHSFTQKQNETSNNKEKVKETKEHEENQEQGEQEGSFDQFVDGLLGKLVVATRASNALPEEEAYNYYSKISPFQSAMDTQANNLLDTISSLVEQQPLPNNPEPFSDSKNLATNYDRFQDVLEGFLELTDDALDDVSGHDKKHMPSQSEGSQKTSKSKQRTSHRQAVVRPQTNWTDVDNSNKPFQPRVPVKFHAVEPWNEEHKRPSPGETWPHPYQDELENLTFGNIGENIGQHVVPHGMDEVDCEWISSSEDLKKMIEELEIESEIAVDVEHHDLRSFLGFACLIQISSRRKDYLVDPFDLRTELYHLNRVFVHPNIVKVLHGADKDIEWLQRDFGLYIVNMFDTGQASRVLHLPSFSLAYLLKVYAGVEADKRFQTADWRLRPLPHNMVHYARQDTHYLLYVYDRLRTELRSRSSPAQDLLLEVLQRSKAVCLRRYEKPLYSPEFARALYERFSGSEADLESPHYRTFVALHKWRDSIARKQDESVRYIMPDHMLYAISSGLPNSRTGLFELCKPVNRIVRSHSNDILKIINIARDQNKHEKDVDTVIAQVTDSSGDITSSSPTSSNLGSNSTRAQVSFTSHRTSSKSPVMSTQQLYRRAQWIDPTRHTNNSDVSINMKSKSSLFRGEQPPPSPNQKRVSDLMNSKFGLGVSQHTPNVRNKPASKSGADTFNTPVAGKPSTPEDDEIPQSMSEIYKLSKRNRKRNKDKKKLKEDNVTHSAPAFSPASRSNNAEDTSPLDFMRNIGWVGSEEQPAITQSISSSEGGGGFSTPKTFKSRKPKKNVYDNHPKPGSTTRKTNFYKGFGNKGPGRGRKSFSKR